MVNTFVYVGGKLIITLPIAFLIAVLVHKSSRNKRGCSIRDFYATIMSSAVMALIFYLIFNTYNGSVNKILMSAGLIKQNVNWLGVNYAMLTVIIIAVWGAIGNYMVYLSRD